VAHVHESSISVVPSCLSVVRVVSAAFARMAIVTFHRHDNRDEFTIRRSP